MRTIVFALTAVVIAACGPTAPVEEQPDPEAAAEVGPVEALPRTLPPPSADPRFVGLWAVSEDLCANPAWRFRADGVSTQGEVSCSFGQVSEIPGGYNVTATCHAEGETTQHEMQITFAESARAMMVANGPWSPAPGLVYCGPLTSQ
jgi:hypothetical protein